MGKTYKSSFGCLRSPRGYRRAKLAKVRRRAIPPNPWDDIPHCSSTQIPYKIAFMLHKKGWQRDRIIEHLKHKFKMKDFQAHRIVSKFYWWKCKCDSCREAWTEHRWH